MNTYWISISDPTKRRGFYGVVIIDANTPEEGLSLAIQKNIVSIDVLKLSIKVWVLNEDHETDYSSYKNKLLSREELKDIGQSTLDTMN